MQALLTFIVIIPLAWLVLRQVVIVELSPEPDIPGVDDGQLAPCPESPNCVSTQADPGDSEHYIEPVSFDGDVDTARQRMVAILQGMDRTTIETAEGNMIHATARSLIMGFIDDVVIYFDEATNTVHMRSAARLGYSDMGVNRNRIEQIKQQFQAQSVEQPAA